MKEDKVVESLGEDEVIEIVEGYMVEGKFLLPDELTQTKKYLIGSMEFDSIKHAELYKMIKRKCPDDLEIRPLRWRIRKLAKELVDLNPSGIYRASFSATTERPNEVKIYSAILFGTIEDVISIFFKQMSMFLKNNPKKRCFNLIISEIDINDLVKNFPRGGSVKFCTDCEFCS